MKICNEGLKKVCDNTTVGAGEEVRKFESSENLSKLFLLGSIFKVCKTHYETTCETRFKEHEVEQDEPVCTMVTERKCKDVRGDKTKIEKLLMALTYVSLRTDTTIQSC